MAKQSTVSIDSESLDLPTGDRRARAAAPALWKAQMAGALAYAPVLLASVVQLAMLYLIAIQASALRNVPLTDEVKNQFQRTEAATKRLVEAVEGLEKANGAVAGSKEFLVAVKGLKEVTDQLARVASVGDGVRSKSMKGAEETLGPATFPGGTGPSLPGGENKGPENGAGPSGAPAAPPIAAPQPAKLENKKP